MAALSKAYFIKAVASSVRKTGYRPRWFSDDGFARMNVFKDAGLAPKEMEDKDYPDWLWRIQDPLPTKEELLRDVEKHYSAGGFDSVFENMEEKDLKRLFRLEQRDHIREENSRRRGGNVV